MPRYVDTQLKQFQFQTLSQSHTITVENELHRQPRSSRHMFDFGFTPDEPWATMESLEEIDAILIQELGTNLDDLH